MGYYYKSDFGQVPTRCPECGENKIFIKRYFKLVSLYYFPIYPLGKGAEAHCRACQKQFSPGNNADLDIKMDQALDELETPKWFKAGAIILPSLVVLGTILILVWK